MAFLANRGNGWANATGCVSVCLSVCDVGALRSKRIDLVFDVRVTTNPAHENGDLLEDGMLDF